MGSRDKRTEARPGLWEKIGIPVKTRGDLPFSSELPRRLKRSVTIRLDSDLYAWFQLSGRGYQTRINAVLRAFMESRSAVRGSTTHGVFQTAGTNRSRTTRESETPLPKRRSRGRRPANPDLQRRVNR